jgi:uncharacterized lipoprotein YajG
MKHLIILLTFFTISCNAQSYELIKTESIELPAYAPTSENSKVMITKIDNSKYDKYQKVVYNKKEYSMKDIQKILDTIGKDYIFDIKIDTLMNRKILFIKEKLNK